MHSQGSISCSIVSAASTSHPHLHHWHPIYSLPQTQPNPTPVRPYTIYTPTTPTNLPPNSHPLYTPPIYTPTPHQNPTCIITSVSTTSLHPTQLSAHPHPVHILPKPHLHPTYGLSMSHPHPNYPSSTPPPHTDCTHICLSITHPHPTCILVIANSGSLKSNTKQLNSSKQQR